MGIIVDTYVADSTFVCNEAFIDDSCSDRFVVFCIFREYSFVWFLVDSVEWLERTFGVVGDPSAECFGLGVAVWAEISEVFYGVVCVVPIYMVNVERER